MMAMTMEALTKGLMPRSNREAGMSCACPYSALISRSPAGGEGKSRWRCRMSGGVGEWGSRE